MEFAEDVALLRALSALVAEGIDSPATAGQLRTLGCDALQGDHPSPGLTKDEITSLLAMDRDMGRVQQPPRSPWRRGRDPYRVPVAAGSGNALIS